MTPFSKFFNSLFCGIMIVRVELNNKTDLRITEDVLSAVFWQTINQLDLPSDLLCHDFEVSVAFVSDNEIAKLNAEYRKKDAPTDILSFAEYPRFEDMGQEKSKTVFLGELIVSPGFMQASAEENGVSFVYEIPYILSHGLLHLFSLQHGARMFGIQDQVAMAMREKIEKIGPLQ